MCSPCFERRKSPTHCLRFVSQQRADGIRLDFEARPAAIRTGSTEAGPVQCCKIGARKTTAELFSEDRRGRRRAVNEKDVPLGVALFSARSNAGCDRMNRSRSSRQAVSCSGRATKTKNSRRAARQLAKPAPAPRLREGFEANVIGWSTH